ncbi:MAG: spondin domain-containing protein [Bacteroidia bacterium]|nr:spondin domain-containing protein [Bacteroidia bacterium]NND52705.1 hypothetical protein [Flavobacteriaceae bacterium]
MRLNLKLIAMCFSLALFSCSTDNGNNNGGGNNGGLNPTAVYRITFTGDFTANSHPTDYPNNASFEGMFIMAHSNASSLFSVGQLASDGLELYVEEGDNSLLTTEHTPVMDNDPTTIIVNGNDIGPTGTDVVQITITPETTYLSIVSKITPSPDWFVGIDGFNLANPDNSLVEDVTISLAPIDAGTDSGTTYESPDMEDSSFIALFSGPPFADPNPPSVIERMGTIRIQRIDITE